MMQVNSVYYQPNDLFSACEANGSKFAIFFEPPKAIDFDFSEYSIVLLMPSVLDQKLSLQARSVIQLAKYVPSHERDGIISGFKQGISSERASKIVDGLVLIASAALGGKSVDPYYAFEFLGIPCH